MKPGSLHTPVFVVAVVLGAAALQSTGLEPQQPTFRARVDLVPVDVAVHRGGRPFAGLSKADFEILDNGVRQTIERVDNENVPLEAWLVLDVSSSLQGQPLVRLQEAASAFAAAFAPGDRAGLVTFSHDVLVAQPLTGDLPAVRTALGQLRAGGATALYDATYVALQLRHPSAARGVAVVLTDGADNASWLTAERVLEAARRSDLVLYGIGVNEATPPASRISGEPIRHPELAPKPPAFADLPQYRFLRGLAAIGAGAVFDASFATLRETFARVLADIRARYLLAYYPTSATPGWHSLEVKLRGASGEVTARRGYWVAPLPGGPK
jgi:Ca-activated chloride channel homolog